MEPEGGTQRGGGAKHRVAGNVVGAGDLNPIEAVDR
jgi:hypothetical protein